jgi:hypothetical protein
MTSMRGAVEFSIKQDIRPSQTRVTVITFWGLHRQVQSFVRPASRYGLLGYISVGHRRSESYETH